jgi:dTDP-4-amino-4,6-dideoxygalactose transaminase
LIKQVPFFRPQLGDLEVNEVVETLRSGWLTSGKRVKLFEEKFATAIGAPYAVALNSCTAALHLAVEALGLKAGQGVLVPTMTFAATAEVVRYLGAVPILVDCDPVSLNIDLSDCELRIANSELLGVSQIVGIMPVHVGGMIMDVGAIKEFADRNNLWVVEDAAHAFPAAARIQRSEAGAQRPGVGDQMSDGVKRKARGTRQEADANEWQWCGEMAEGERRVVCFSFYANKTITTGEGGMAVTGSAELAERMRLMSLHGLSQDAWERYSGGSSWDYRIVAPGFKYNLTDIAAAIGIHQLARAEEMRCERERIARCYLETFADIEELELPPNDPNRIHAWHLFPIRLYLGKLKIDRNEFIQELKRAGVGCSVHWRPLHLHPYYQETFGWKPEDFPVATAVWERLISLPIFPGMRTDELHYVMQTIRDICRRHSLSHSGYPEQFSTRPLASVIGD